MEMDDQYGAADLREYMSGRPQFPAIPPAGDIFICHPHVAEAHHYEMVMAGHHHHRMSEMVTPAFHDQFRSDSTATTPTTSVTPTSTASLSGLDMDGSGGGEGGTARWPRQETLALLDIRSRLDFKFKEANQKGPLWDEVSRIMYEERGYQRSGKKCREKFENLYKYYKKTRDGKAGRQNGKHYRFFRQLEALYGETSNPGLVSETTHFVGNRFQFHSATNTTTTSALILANHQEAFQAPKLSDQSLTLSSSSDLNSSSSDGIDASEAVLMDNDLREKRKKRKSWKTKIRDFIDAQMRKLMEKQEAWLEKMMMSLERKEEERMARDEEWRKQEAARIDREHKFWANERAWIEARDAALMEALQKLTGKELRASSPEEVMAASQLPSLNENINHDTISHTLKDGDSSWQDGEITKLIQLRTSMESKFHHSKFSEEVMWERIAAQMACLGYDRSALICKHKWDSIDNLIVTKTKEGNKKRKENSRSCSYTPANESMYNEGDAYCEINGGQEPDSTTPPNFCNASNVIQDSCLRLLMGDGGNLWESIACGVKLSQGENH